MNSSLQDKAQLPLVRLNLAQPFLAAAQAAGVDVDVVLAPFGVNALAFANPDMFLPAATMYDLVEVLGDSSDDPFIGVHLGASLDVFQWPPLARAASMAHSVGDLILRFAIDAHRDANSVVMRLDTQGKRTIFSEVRLTRGSRPPRHNDGFGAGLILNLLHATVGARWDGREVIVSVCDTSVFPANYLGVRLAQHDTRGISINFPCEWLLLEPCLKQPVTRTLLPDESNSSTPHAPLSALRHILLTNLHDPNLNADRVAVLCGISKRTLSRRLSDMGTSLRSELEAMRRERAETDLAGTTLTVAQIGRSIGYRDTSVFTRAFKRWTGKTPRQFREESR